MATMKKKKKEQLLVTMWRNWNPLRRLKTSALESECSWVEVSLHYCGTMNKLLNFPETLCPPEGNN